MTLSSAASTAEFRPLRFALRELRGGLHGFRIFVACIALGVMAIAGVGSFSRSLTDGLARQVVEGVLAGEGGPDEVVAARGLAVVSDESALGDAVDTALAAMPDVADKVRSGKVQAAGALVGAVMKATRGQADASVVRRLVLAKLGVEG